MWWWKFSVFHICLQKVSKRGLLHSQGDDDNIETDNRGSFYDDDSKAFPLPNVGPCYQFCTASLSWQEDSWKFQSLNLQILT